MNISCVNWDGSITPAEHLSLELLCDQTYAAVVVYGFYSPAQCEQLLASFDEKAATHEAERQPMVLRRYGTTFQRERYLAQALDNSDLESQKARIFGQRMPEALDDLGPACEQYRKALLELLRLNGIAANVATENGLPYSMPCYREFESGGLQVHYDWCPLNDGNFVVGNVTHQLAVNLYASIPTEGGDLFISDVQPDFGRDYSAHSLKPFGFTEEVVGDARRVSVHPELGSLVFFNSLNWHWVSGFKSSTENSRVAFSGFVGHLPNDNWVVWS